MAAKTMKKKKENIEDYHGFEQGPIRPPSEAYSLLIRVTRNCPWNRCTFCPIYKKRRFSIRPIEHVFEDIDTVAGHVDSLRKNVDSFGRIERSKLSDLNKKIPDHEVQAFNAALHWFSGGMRSIFIQDANSLIVPPPDMIRILRRLKHHFYWVERITSYARSHTVARIKDKDLESMADAGLNRIHIGMESGADSVLKMVKKGVTKATHIKAGLKVKKAGIQLSEYVMPGLGGKKLSREHALETADALNQIDPEFIRLRSLAIPNVVSLFDDWEAGRFEKLTDVETAEEILLFIESLEGIESEIKSDHVLNLFEEIEGKLPDDKDKMVEVIRQFLDMPPEMQCIYQVGKRLGVFRRLDNMSSPARIKKVEQACKKNNITPANVDGVIDELMKRFI
jgi:histone acetyltransferase (RNA polymerase elongator complex component)